MAELLFRIGRFAARRRLVVGGTWLAILAIAAAAYAVGGGPLTGQLSIPGTPTDQVAQRLTAEIPGAAGATGTVVFHTEDGSALTAAQQAAISKMVGDASGIDGVKQVIDPFATEAQRQAQAQQIADGKTQLDQGQAQLTQGQAQLTQAQAQLTQAQDQLDQGQAQLDAARAQAEAAGQIDQVKAQLDAQQAQIDDQQAQINQGQAQLDQQQAQIDENRAQLDAHRQQLEAGSALLKLASGIRLVSEDGSTVMVPVQFTGSQLVVSADTQHAVISTFESTQIDGVAVDFSSSLTLAVPNILGLGELAGVLISAVVLFIMLGTLVGAGLPIVTAVLGLGIGVLGSLSLASVVDMVSVTPVLGVMLGLAVGIDYALFIINRHRHQLREGYEVEESIALANGTSGNAVVFAGSTVVIALLALNVTGIPFLGLMGTVGAACVALAVLISVTLTPALLSLLGMRILSRREVARLGTPEHRPSAAAVRELPTPRALVQVVVGVAVLVVLAVPVASMRLGLPDGSWESANSTEYRTYTIIADKFGPGANGPLVVVADLPGTPTPEEATAAQLQIAQQLAAIEDVAAVAPIGTSSDGTMIAFQIVPTEGPSSASTEQLVTSLRDASPLPGDIEIGVAGSTSGSIDISKVLADALPLYLLLVVGLSLLIMVLVFRSILLPIIATGGFVLSLLATLGGLVVIIQWGWFNGLLGVAQPIPILNFLPTVMAGILFGLAMDYTLFLATGMREAYVHGANARIAVVLGFKAGRSVVTAAALIMISVFGGFVFSESTTIRPIGFALAFGVLIDAFVVRMLIMPGVMHLAGRWAWWLPRWLDRLLPNVDVEGSALERRHPHVATEHLAAESAGQTTPAAGGPADAAGG